MNEAFILLADIEAGRFDIIFYAFFASLLVSLLVACVCSLFFKGPKR